jgi:hypothetical protein
MPTAKVCWWKGRRAQRDRVMLFLIVGLLCLVRPGRPQRPFWWAIAALLLVLGLSRLANFEQIVTDFGRGVAISYGWYNTRRSLQSMGIFGILIGSGVVIIYMLARLQRLRAPEAIGLLAIGSLLTLILVRSISLHAVDNILDLHIRGVQVGSLLEALIMIWIIGAAFWKESQPRAGS